MNEAVDRPLRGVNLGGWLVLEKWMTPSLFEGTHAADEYTFMQMPDAEAKLKRHRQTFIREADFKWLAGHGINAVRIPVGYWLLRGGEPYIKGIEYLDFAVTMAERYSMKVLIDLHGAPGSQNGYDHSGRAGRADWFCRGGYRDKTIEIATELTRRYNVSTAFWGVELLNEPKSGPVKYWLVRHFYRRAYRAVTQVARPGVCIVFSDAFTPRLFSGVIKAAERHPAVMDVHWYQFGTVRLPRYFRRIASRKKVVNRLQQRQPVIIGEWSGMLTGGTLAGMAEEDKLAAQRQHIEAQLAAYAAAAGWFYWSYKTEEAGIWNFRWLVESGMIPLDQLSVVH